ncbi:hypothetical protein ACFL4Z_01015 [candidate division KSB1 bacterium]
MNERGKRFLVLFLFFLFVCIFSISVTGVFAQDWARNYIRNRQRLDLRNLGYPLVNEIPANSCAVTSLLNSSNGMIYGGTSGEEAYLFVFDPSTNKVKHLGKMKGEEGIHHSLAEGKDGSIYIGTGKSMFKEISISKGGIGREYFDVTLWKDIKNYYKDYPGGHLYRYNPRESNAKIKLPDMDCEVLDLGIPVPNNSIYTLTVSPGGDEIYGITYPDGHFFIYNISRAIFEDKGEIDKSIVFHGPERYWRSLPRALVCDDGGNVYTSSTNGEIVYYSPSSGEFVSTGLRIPGDYYPAKSYRDYAVVECFAKSEDGLIYGGASDGHLFSFSVENMELINLGKPRVSRRMRALTVDSDGKVYMIAGDQSKTKYCQFYCYDPERGGFEDFGVLMVDRSPYYYWRGHQFDCMTTARDGTIYLGESERRAHLFIYIP